MKGAIKASTGFAKAKVGFAAVAAAMALNQATLIRAEENTTNASIVLTAEDMSQYGQGIMKYSSPNGVQMGRIFTENTSKIEANILAVPQKCQSAFLINGFGNDNIWYQYGLEYGTKGTFGVTMQLWSNHLPMMRSITMAATNILPHDVLKLKMEVAQGKVNMTAEIIGRLVDNGGRYVLQANPNYGNPADRFLFTVPTQATTFKGTAPLGRVIEPTAVFTEFFGCASNFNWQTYQIKTPKLDGSGSVFFCYQYAGKLGMLRHKSLPNGFLIGLDTGLNRPKTLMVDDCVITVINSDQFITATTENRDNVLALPEDMDEKLPANAILRK